MIKPFCNLYIALSFIGVICLFSSCVNQRQVVYFQKNNSADSLSIPQPFVPKIQPGDMLSINITSASPEANQQFNMSMAPSSSAKAGDMSSPVATLEDKGYLVDADGNIEYPVVGKIKLEGLTSAQAALAIKQNSNVLKYLTDPTVRVRIQNFKISVLGEVMRPSTYVVPNEKISLPEALSLAGDLTIGGRRDNVQVVREENGKKVFATIDLTRRDVFTSPYYYLHPNDLIYVAPSKGRISQTDRIYQILPIVLSLLTVVSVILLRK